MIWSKTLRTAAVAALAIALVGSAGCGRTRSNAYALEITGPIESERIRLLLDEREIANFAGYTATVNVSLDERTPFPNAKPPAALKAEFFGPDGWTASAATIDSRDWPEAIESKLAKGETLPLAIHVERPELTRSLLLYVDNRGRKQAAKITLGLAERSVAAGEATRLNFLAPTRDEGRQLRVNGVEVGRLRPEKATTPDEGEQICWLVDVSGQHVYRRRIVVFQERVFSYTAPYKKDPGTILKSARLYEIPNHLIDYFLEGAPSSIMSPDLGVTRLELVDLK